MRCRERCQSPLRIGTRLAIRVNSHANPRNNTHEYPKRFLGVAEKAISGVILSTGIFQWTIPGPKNLQAGCSV
jgi:hypothetical protein